MDSGNSGSMQSSSGDEEYDSRSESAATAPPVFFMNPHPHPHHYHYQNQPPPPPPPPAAFFDIPSSSNTFLHPLSQSQSPSHHQHNSNPSPFLNLDLISSRTNNNKSLQQQGLIINHGTFSISSSSSSSRAMPSRLLNNDHQNNKNPKKRTRTSRRAPTTVLTTDTSNFRAMVQEFTGIPAQPFSVGLPYSHRRRLDLFKPAGNNENLETMGGTLNNYPLLRPTTQKFQPIQQAFVSSSIDATTTTTTSTTIATSISDTTSHKSGTCNNYQFLSDLGLNSSSNKEPQNMLNNFVQQNLNPPHVSFQSLLQHSTLDPSLNLIGGAFAANNESQGGSFGVPSLEDHHHHHHLAMSHAHVGLPNQHHLRSFEGSFGNSSQRVTSSCKMNYSASATDFHHDKNLENVSSRGGEGTVDSWICPPD